MKIRIKPVGKPSPYVEERDRVWFAYETELELKLQEEIIDPLPSPRFQSKLMRKRAEKH